MKKFTVVISFLFSLLTPVHLIYGYGLYRPPVYDPPTFLDFTYILPSYAAEDGLSHAIKGDRLRNSYDLLLNQYLPGITQAIENKFPEEELGSDLEEEKALFIVEAHKLLKIKGIDNELSINPDNHPYGCCLASEQCFSNNHHTANEFLQAALSIPGNNADYLELAQIRLQIFDLCCYDNDRRGVLLNGNELLDKIETLKNKNNSLTPYFHYLEALVYFYDNNDQQALAAFEDISSQPEISPWLKETTMYMVGRLYLISSQKNRDGLSKDVSLGIDKVQLNKASVAFEAYIKQYPQGLYTNSAIGIKRNIAWLAGNQAELNSLLVTEMGRLFDNPHDLYHISLRLWKVRLWEFHHYFKGDIDISTAHPLLIGYDLLDKVRIDEKIFENLSKIKEKFEPYPGLYRWVKAGLLYRNKQYDLLLKEIKAENLEDTPTSIATATLRARSYAQLGKRQEALKEWQNINSVHTDDIAQIELAALYADSREFETLLNDKYISNARILADFLRFATTDIELEELEGKNLPSPSKILVQQELFKRYLLTQRFKAMKELYSRNIDPGIYKDIKSFVEVLASTPHDAKSNMEIGLFIYNHYINPEAPTSGKQYYFEPTGLEEIKHYCSICKHYEKTLSFMSAYDYLIKAEQEYNKVQLKSEEEAKTLHYLTKCFRGREPRNRCMFDKEYENVSKKWFKRLHTLYPESEWTKETPYYY